MLLYDRMVCPLEAGRDQYPLPEDFAAVEVLTVSGVVCTVHQIPPAEFEGNWAQIERGNLTLHPTPAPKRESEIIRLYYRRSNPFERKKPGEAPK